MLLSYENMRASKRSPQAITKLPHLVDSEELLARAALHVVIADGDCFAASKTTIHTAAMDNLAFLHMLRLYANLC